MSDDLGEEGKQPPKLKCPPNWELAPLSAIAEVALGKTPSKNDYRNDGKCKIVKYRDLGDDRQIAWTNSAKGFIGCDRAKAKNLRALQRGDVLISASAHASEIIGRKVLYVAQLPEEFAAVYYVGEILCIRIDQCAAPELSKLVNYFFQSQNGYKTIQAKVHGVHLIGSRAAEMTVPVPPRTVQKRIVSRIEELFSRIEEGERALQRAQRLVESYRQSVLKAAVTGELTRDWRKRNRRKLETGNVLLARILKARRTAWEVAELAKMKAKGIKPANDKWKQKYEEPTPPDTTDLSALPNGWIWASAEQVCGFITKGTTPPAESMTRGSGEVPYIKVYNLTFDGSLDFSKDPTYISGATHRNMLARSKVVPGDIVMNIVGPPLGKVSIVPDTAPEWNMNQAVAVFRPFNGFERRFFAWHLLSRAAQDWYATKAKASVGQLNLTLEICRATPVPIAPHEEQLEIVQLIDKEMSRLSSLASSLRRDQQLALGLRQAVLRAAFAGDLSTRVPVDEPASELLKQIANKRDTDSTKPKRSSKKRDSDSTKPKRSSKKPVTDSTKPKRSSKKLIIDSAKPKRSSKERVTDFEKPKRSSKKRGFA